MNPTPQTPPVQGQTVHLMLTCLCDAFFPEVGIATVECLEHLGFRVAFLESQTCCGQPAFNSGDRKSARSVARHCLKVFEKVDHLICPSGSCSAMIRWGYPQLFRDEVDAEQALGMGARTWELSEFLTAVGPKPWPGRYPKKIAFHRSCHMRELSKEAGPETILKSIAGLELMTPQQSEQCCGFGGTFAVSFSDISTTIGSAKLQTLVDCEADEWVTSDMGCLMHLEGYRRHQDHKVFRATGTPFRHYVQVLRDCLATT